MSELHQTTLPITIENLRCLIEMRKLHGLSVIADCEQKGRPCKYRDRIYWEGRVQQCEDILSFLDGKVELRLTTTIAYNKF